MPWLGLFHKIALADEFCLFDDVQYLKKDWNNRNKIKTTAGEVWLSVPVFTTDHREKKIREIEIDNSSNWSKKHFKSIYLNYKKAPYFKDYIDFFDDVYKKEWKYLTDLNDYMLKWFLKELGIKVKYIKASDYDFKGQKSDLVLDMCEVLKADTYIFGKLGEDYADKETFSKAGVAIHFQNYNHPEYEQLHGEFIPYMSVVDLLFNCGKKSLDIITKGNICKIKES